MQNRIDKVLNEQGKTYKDLVSLTGLSEYGIGKMAQASDDEDLGAWFSLARALDVSPAYLVGWSDKPSEDKVDMRNVLRDYASITPEPGPRYDFVKPEPTPTSGVKITLDDGRVICNSREYDDFDDYILHGDWLFLNSQAIAMKHIVSIEKVSDES